MFEGLPSHEKDPRSSLHLQEIALPELAPDEAVIAVMASSINFNTVWSAIFEPVSTFGFLARLGREGYWGARHDQDFHAVGSDASGVVLRVGSAVRKWKPGDKVVVHCNHVDDQDPSGHNDSMLADNQRIWGFETNYGGLADLSVVKANQLMPKPAHLTWEESAVNALCNSTSYRMLVSPNAAADEPGRRRVDLGRHRRPRRLRRAVRPQRRRYPGRRRVVGRQGLTAQRHRLRRGDRPQGSRLPVLGRRAHPGRVGMASARQGHPRAHRTRRRHRLRASGSPDLRRLGVRRPLAAAPSSRVRPPAGSWSSSTTATSG